MIDKRLVVLLILATVYLVLVLPQPVPIVQQQVLALPQVFDLPTVESCSVAPSSLDHLPAL